MGVAQFWELVSHLYFFLWSAPTHHPTQPFRFSVCLDGTIGLPGAEILFWERFVLDHELWKRLLLSVPGPLQKRSQLQQWLKVLCCGGFSLLLIGTESEHGTTCFSIWPFPIRTTGKILIAGPCASRFVSNNSRPNSDKNLKMRKEDEKIRQKNASVSQQKWRRLVANRDTIPAVIAICKNCSQILTLRYEDAYLQYKC